MEVICFIYVFKNHSLCSNSKALLLMLIRCVGLPVGGQAFISMKERSKRTLPVIFVVLVLNILPSFYYHIQSKLNTHIHCSAWKCIVSIEESFH